METVKAQITDFLTKCEELKNCKFIMATSKIKDLLKAIVNSPELYDLFNTVASGFDYPAVKQRCFKEGNRCRVVLPDTVGERLAFIFCLLVEFDRNEINFNAFLQKYYPKDGSFYSSYHMFCDEVIGALENIICDVFAQELEEEEKPQITARASRPALKAPVSRSTLYVLISAEIDAVSSAPLAAEDAEAAKTILNSLAEAVERGDYQLVKSLTCGYNYFMLYTNFVSDTVAELFEELGEMVE